MSTPFDTLTALRDEWLALQPLSAENEARLWKKLRLEWNYHSNHIEGNTLTYGETELLLLHDRTTGNHSHREYLEMKAHDVGIEHVRTLADDQTRLLTEGDIRDLNKIILKESFWKAAETADGQPTRKEIIPGQYKTTPNNVRLPNGDIFFFASVEDTSPKMQAFAVWLRQELESPTLHPAAFAAKLHHDFVLIHPFDDGNGRVARLLVNYVLMRSGYLPLIVRTEDKANYLTALQLADAGELSALISYFHQLTEWSLKLGIKAAKGKTIEEPSDVEKEIELFVKAQEAEGQQTVPRTPDLIAYHLKNSIEPFFKATRKKMASLSPLFGQTGEGSQVTTAILRAQIQSLAFNRPHPQPPPKDVEEHFAFYGYKGSAKAPFDLSVSLRVAFEPGDYQVMCDGRMIKAFLYDELLTANQVEEMSAQVLKSAFQRIKVLSGIKE
jgi:fido (protein-threonine AMPylation protein)